MTTTAEGTATSRRTQLKFVLVLGGLTAFGPLSIDMYLPALPRMANDLHAADATVQLTLSAFIVGLALGQLVLGPLSDALGRRRPLLVGLVLYVVGSVLCAVSPDAWLLVAARGVQSLGAAAGIVIARATVRDLYSGTAMTKFFSTLMLVSGLAPILAPLIGGQLLNWTSWRGVFVVLTVFGALLLAVVVFAFPEPSVSRSPARLGQVMRTYGRLVLDRSFAGYALAAGLLFASMFAYISGSSFALQGVYGLSPQAYSVVFGVNGVGIVLAGQLNGRLVGRVPERTLLLSGLLLGVFGGASVLVSAVTRAPWRCCWCRCSCWCRASGWSCRTRVRWRWRPTRVRRGRRRRCWGCCSSWWARWRHRWSGWAGRGRRCRWPRPWRGSRCWR